MNKNTIDKFFLGIVIALVALGAVMFTSSSLGILARNEAKFYAVLSSQFIFGLLGGIVALYLGFKIPYKFWRKYSLFFFIASLGLTALVLLPGMGFAHGGAKRWLTILGYTFQPVEFLKIGFIIYFSAWLSWAKGRVRTFQFSILPLMIFLGVIALVLLKQPDTKSLILITLTALGLLFVSGTPFKYILLVFAISIVAFGVLVSFKPYLMQRVNTFMNPGENASTSSYQLRQSLIAIGSGGIFGRGLGQSIQKFNYLPEPQGDSIFAVIGEELGLIGGSIIICLYIAFAMRGFRIAINAPDPFSKFIVFGFILIITAQSFMNIASITGVFPLTGVPLVFMSQGGTSLLLSLGMIGIILNISQFSKNQIVEEK